ncbi:MULTISPECIES: exosortase A [Vibrio]|uniref:exosortase A n=1 Tax=Vibrio TaxID=662 RepID=UPI000BFFC749|nr:MULTISPECIES: exosortase A [unclassified Vibrio]
MIKLPIYRFILPLITWAFVYHESIESMVTVWSQSKTYEHGFIIVPISLWLTWRKRDQIKQTPLGSSWIPVVLFIFPTLCWMFGKAADVALLEHIAAIFSLQLILWALLGTPLTKILFFPIFYLIFCIPFGEELVPYLQVITADITVFALQLSNIPVYREGLFLEIPNGQFEVAEACSGIRFLISSLALGTLFAYLSFNKWWKILIFVGFSFIFPIIANGIRAYGIVLIGYLSDMKYATGADHLVYGWVFFAFVIGIIFYISDKFADNPRSSATSQKPNHVIRTPAKTLTMSICFTAVLFLQFKWEASLQKTDQQAVSPIRLPDQITEVHSSVWGISFPQALTVTRGVTPDGRVEYFSARYSIRQKHGELISSVNHLYDQNKWALNSNSKHVISPQVIDAFNATQLTIANHYGESMKVLYWYCIDNVCSSNPLEIKLIKATKLMTERSGTADILALASFDLTDEQLQALAKAWMANGDY